MKISTISLINYNSAFGYVGYFVHARSGLNLTVHRAYDSTLARSINRDPIGELCGVNLYGYVGADPLGGVDGSGLQTLQGYISNDDEGSGSAGISAGSGLTSPLSGGTSCNFGGGSSCCKTLGSGLSIATGADDGVGIGGPYGIFGLGLKNLLNPYFVLEIVATAARASISVQLLTLIRGM